MKNMHKLKRLKKSWTMYFSALLLAAPELITFLPTVKDQIPADAYALAFRVVVILYVLLRVKTEMQKPEVQK
jgi:hypothetical protein